MITKLQIINMALQHLGASPISAIDETSKQAESVNSCYEIVKLSLLNEHPWSFAIRRAALALLSEAPAFEYKSQFQKPNDCIRILGTHPTTEYIVEASVILCNEAALNVRYISSSVTEEEFSPIFCELLAVKLAYEISYSLTGNASLYQTLAQLYANKTQEAKAVNALEVKKQRGAIVNNIWTDR